MIASVLLSSLAVGVSLAEAPFCAIRRADARIPYGTIPAFAPVGMSLTNGLMLKAGKPHFWLGQGDGPGASQSGPFGLWLTWLQHNDAVTLNGGMHFNVVDAVDGRTELSVRTDRGIQSWRREAVRYGLLTDFFYGSGFRPQSSYGKVVARHPGLADVICAYGHYLKVDAGYPLGVAINVALRRAVSDYLLADPGTGYMELCREPGPDPRNVRARELFRAFARGKYGSLEKADRIWGTHHADWSDVMPPHLDDRLHAESGAGAVGRRREYVRTHYAAFYWDWIAAVQDDVARWVKAEIDVLRIVAPALAFTIDVRGHTSRGTDGYAMLVPEDIDPSEDLFSIHQGTHSYVFGGRPYDAESVVHSASFPLFNMNYFRVNTRGAIVNAEDIVSSAKAPAADADRMKANCLGRLTDSDWAFRRDDSDCGLREKWFSVGTDVSNWDSAHVPGTWDAQPCGRGYSGVAWYRKTFVVPGRFRNDHEDGSRVFRLRGTGVAQRGTAWLNGVKLGDVRGWSTPYAFDVGALLRYGDENTLVWRIDGLGKADNGLRFDTYLLADDQMSVDEPFDERQFRKLAFNQLFAGLSGAWIWHWHDDAVRTYQPRLYAQLQTAAEIALPDLRHRRGDVAYLYSYRNQPGLPSQSEGTYRGYGDFQCALDFLGHKPDIFGERRFREEVTPERYPTLVVPYLATVEDETYAHFKRYVQAGGLALLTTGSLVRTYSEYAPTDIATFDRGKGRVVMLSGRPGMDELFDILTPYLSRPEIEITAEETTAERPLVERLLAGSDERKVLYLCNWGGIDQALCVALPPRFATWRLTNLVGSFTRRSDGALSVKVPSQDVAVAVVESPGVDCTRLRSPSSLRQRKLDELQDLLAAAGPVSTCDVLMMRNAKTRGGYRMGPELMPEYLRAFRDLGLTYGWSEPTEWTAGTLRGKRLVVMCESNSNAFFKYHLKPELIAALTEYVRGGGSLMIVSALSDTVNVDGLAIAQKKGLARAFGIGRDWAAGSSYDEHAAAFGDPCQTLTSGVAPCALTDGIRSVLVYKTGVLSLSPAAGAFPVVSLPKTAGAAAGRPVMAATAFGRGRVFVCGDAMAFQPFRIEQADNAALLINVLGWLTGCPVDADKRKKFAHSLFLTGTDACQILKEEN